METGQPQTTRTSIDATSSWAGGVAELAARAATGDRKAMNRLLRELEPAIQLQLGRYHLSRDERADAMQNALLKVARGLASFRQDARFSTWLFRLTENEALMFLRSRKRRAGRLVTGLLLDELGALPAMRVDRPAELDFCAARSAGRVRRAIANLPPSYGAALEAHYFDDLDLQESSRKLGVSEAAVKSTLWRARARMRSVLRAHVQEAAR